MSRIIQTGETPAKRRQTAIRSSAEVLRLLAERPMFDEESQDMTAFLVFNLRDIYKSIDESAQAWDDRNYWKKSEALRAKWRWSHLAANELEELLLGRKWDEIPTALIQLIPHFNGVTINAITRNSDWWCGAYKALTRASEKD